jgi:hypothetical protein
MGDEIKEEDVHWQSLQCHWLAVPVAVIMTRKYEWRYPDGVH